MLDDLTAQELAMLGHSLRIVPGNACLTGKSATLQGGSGVLFFSEAEAWQSLWEKVAAAVAARDDMEAFRSNAKAPE